LRDRYELAASDESWNAVFRGDCDQCAVIAHDQRDRRQVELRLARSSSFKPDAIYRFQTESEILSAVQSSSFLKPLDWGQVKGIVFGVRQHFPANLLQSMLGESAKLNGREGLPLVQSFSIACGVLDALTHVHQSGCVYRNVCSAKIFVDGQQAYLVCPGPEDYLESNSGQGNEFVELAKFASPERSGSIEHDIGPASDLYSVGVLLFTMLAGRVPFEGDTIGSILFQHVAIDPDMTMLGDEVPSAAWPA
jgi:two-component system sensor kinase